MGKSARGGRSDVCIVIAAHKEYRMPGDDMYLPVEVGAALRDEPENARPHIGYQRDDDGENISLLNGSFCELTGLYWAWKNLDADYIGLAHYRRHFAMPGKGDPWTRVLTYQELAPFLGKVRAFVPSPRKYYIESLYSHYAHTHYASHLDITREIIVERCPEYIPDFDRVMRQTQGCMFNMMILERGLFDDYCGWLFPVLFELRERLGDQSGLSPFQARLYGRVSEILFNVWLAKQVSGGTLKRDGIMEIPLVHMEKVNWLKKGSSFLRARFGGRKYEGSF